MFAVLLDYLVFAVCIWCLFPLVRTLIIGCGYVGLPLAVELTRGGHEVYGICRSSERATEISRLGVNPLVTDMSGPTALEGIEPGFDWI